MVVQKGNKQLEVPDSAKEIYLSLGFSIIDEDGKIIEAGQATSLSEIKEENATLKNKLQDIYNENEALKAEIKALNDAAEANKKGK